MLQCDTEQRGTTPNKTLRTTENSNMLPKKKKKQGEGKQMFVNKWFQRKHCVTLLILISVSGDPNLIPLFWLTNI